MSFDGRADYLRLGDHNAICDVCGWKFKASQLRERWDGLMVCEADWETRHPQLDLRAIPDQMRVPWTRPDTVVDANGNPVGDTFIGITPDADPPPPATMGGAYGGFTTLTGFTGHYIGGTISGLPGTPGVNIELNFYRPTLGVGQSFVTHSNGFDGSMGGSGTEGTPYETQILVQPPGYFCTVTNGNGVIGSSDVTDIQITCAASVTGTDWTPWDHTLDGASQVLAFAAQATQAIAAFDDDNFLVVSDVAGGGGRVTLLTRTGNTVVESYNFSFDGGTTVIPDFGIVTLDATTALITYTNADTTTNHLLLITRTGSTISLTNNQVLSYPVNNYGKLAKLDSTHALLVYTDTTVDADSYAAIVTVGGGTTTILDDTLINSTTTRYVSGVCVLSPTSAIVVYADYSGSPGAYAQALSITALTLIAAGSPVLVSANVQGPSFEGLSAMDGTHAVFVGYDSNVASTAAATLLTVSGLSVSAGTPLDVASGVGTVGNTYGTAVNGTQVLVTYQDYSDYTNHTSLLTLSGGVFTQGTIYTTSAANTATVDFGSGNMVVTPSGAHAIALFSNYGSLHYRSQIFLPS